MTAVALIVEYKTPDLLALCLASLRRFAPRVGINQLQGYEGAEAHACVIENARQQFQKIRPPPDRVILLDTDVVILSPMWEALFTDPQFDLIGGYWERKGQRFLHANCLALSWRLFCAVQTFAAIPMRTDYDTAWQVTQEAISHQWPVRVMKSRSLGRVTEYIDANGLALWRHLGRGTDFRPRGFWREGLRRMAAHLGSPRARKILSWQQDRAAFLKKGWEIVNER